MTISAKYSMEPAAFEQTVRATCMKPDRDGKVATKEEFAAFLLVANHYDLNPLTKEIFAFVSKGAVIPIVSVDGWSKILNRNPQMDGLSFADGIDERGNVVSTTCLIFRKDRAHSTEATEYMAECRRDTDVWKKWPRRMLRHKAMIQAARYAFGFAGIYDEDEGARIIEANAIPTPPAPPPIPTPPAPPPAPVAQIAAPEKLSVDFDDLRAKLQAHDNEDAINAAFDEWITPREKAMTDDEMTESNAILREIIAPHWNGEG